ncbi:phage holin family protein [Bizionia sp.]|uniref:phage holin family protein n=1 Tax=Bizionia sp. TaxID=1954480 RepID=UPI003A93E350
MNIFESLSETTGKMTDAGETYVEKSQEYFKLKMFQQLTVSISLVAKALVIGGLLAIGLLFLAFALALAMGEWLGDLALGYLIVAGIFLLVSGIIYLKRAAINKVIIKSLSSKFFDS